MAGFGRLETGSLGLSQLLECDEDGALHVEKGYVDDCKIPTAGSQLRHGAGWVRHNPDAPALGIQDEFQRTLAGDIVSVGIVAEKDYLYKDTKDLEAIFHCEVGNNIWVQQHLAPGKQFGPYRVTGEYSYRSRYCAADGLILAGDAFAFLDPVFSSGVCLALRSGELAGDAADAALRAAVLEVEVVAGPLGKPRRASGIRLGPAPRRTRRATRE